MREGRTTTTAAEPIAEEEGRRPDIIRDKRNLGIHQKNLSLSLLPRVEAWVIQTTEVYEVEIQCELESKSIDAVKQRMDHE